jgi:hypothetical protein
VTEGMIEESPTRRAQTQMPSQMKDDVADLTPPTRMLQRNTRALAAAQVEFNYRV